MTELAVVTGVGGLVAVGFVAWQIGWRRRLESSLRRIPVRVGRARRGAAFGPCSSRVVRRPFRNLLNLRPGPWPFAAPPARSAHGADGVTGNSGFLSGDSGVLSWRLGSAF